MRTVTRLALETPSHIAVLGSKECVYGLLYGQTNILLHGALLRHHLILYIDRAMVTSFSETADQGSH